MEKEKGVLGFHQFASVLNNPFVSGFNSNSSSSSSSSSQTCFSSNDSWSSSPLHVPPLSAPDATLSRLFSSSSSSSFSHSVDVVQDFGSTLDNNKRKEVNLENKLNVEVMKRFCLSSFHSQPGFPSIVQSRDHSQCNQSYSFPKISEDDQHGRSQFNPWISSCCREIDTSDHKTSPTVLKRKFVPHDHQGGMHWNLSPYVSEVSVINPTYNSHLHDMDEKNLLKRGFVMVLQKELRKSDVSRIGRIVLPKKYAETNLPPLSEKDGIPLLLRDFSISALWTFKFRYWPNNKSRMYIMENTGDFIRVHGLKTGDLFIIYREVASGNLIVRGKKLDVVSASTDLIIPI